MEMGKTVDGAGFRDVQEMGFGHVASEKSQRPLSESVKWAAGHTGLSSAGGFGCSQPVD